MSCGTEHVMQQAQIKNIIIEWDIDEPVQHLMLSGDIVQHANNQPRVESELC